MATDAGTEPDQPEPPESASPDPAPAQGRWPRSARVTVAALTLVLVTTLVGGTLVVAHLLKTNDEWQASSQQWEDLARTHGQQAADATARADQLQSDLDDAQDQLTAATKRISELANEKAQLEDAAAAREVADLGPAG